MECTDSTVFHEHAHVITSHRLHESSLQVFIGSVAGLVLIVSNFLAFAGIEMNAIHARDLKNPGT